MTVTARLAPLKVSQEAAAMADLIMIDVGLIEEIEAALAMDCAPPPDVIVPLAARAGLNLPPWRYAPYDDQLEQDSINARQESGTWLELEEIYAVQRLRGWHRARYGNVKVRRSHLADVRHVLGNLRMSLDSECDSTAEEYGIDRVSPVSAEELARREWRDFRDIRSQVLTSMMTDDETCGECDWCWVRRLHITCSALLEENGNG